MTHLFIKDPTRTKKVLYIAPTKALCNERNRDWNSKMQTIYRTCAELTGDSDISEDTEKADLIVTTPEKWDSLTRRWHDHRELLDSIALILVRIPASFFF